MCKTCTWSKSSACNDVMCNARSHRRFRNRALCMAAIEMRRGGAALGAGAHAGPSIGWKNAPFQRLETMIEF